MCSAFDTYRLESVEHEFPLRLIRRDGSQHVDLSRAFSALARLVEQQPDEWANALPPQFVGRVFRMPGCAWRSAAAALLLQALADGRSRPRMQAILAHCERFADIIPVDDQPSVEGTTAALRRYLAAETLPLDRPTVRLRTAGSHHSMVNATRKLMARIGVRSQRDTRDGFPAHHAEGLAFARRMQAELDRLDHDRRSVSIERRRSLAAVADEIVRVSNDRLDQLEAVLAACAERRAAHPPVPGETYWEEVECVLTALTADGGRPGGTTRFVVILANERAILERASRADEDDGDHPHGPVALRTRPPGLGPHPPGGVPNGTPRRRGRIRRRGASIGSRPS